MSTILYLIAVVLIIAWAIGYAYYGEGGLIHGLLVFALAVLLIRLLAKDRILDR